VNCVLVQFIMVIYPPNTPDFGLWYDTKRQRLMAWDGQQWVMFHTLYVSEIRIFEKEIKHNRVIPEGYSAIAVSPTIAEGKTVEIKEGAELIIL